MKTVLAVSALAFVTMVASYGSSLQASLTFVGSASVCAVLGPPGSPVTCDFAPGINETISSSTGIVMPTFVDQSASLPGGGGGASFFGNGSASATFGSVSASVVATTGSSSGASAMITSSGSAGFSDDLFVDTGLGGGTIQYAIEFGGEVGDTESNDTGDGTSTFNGESLFSAFGISATFVPGCTGSNTGGSVFGTCTFNLPFTDGMAIPISGVVTASAFATSGVIDGYGGGSLSVQSITILNSDGTPISNFDWFSSSGSSYAFVGGTETPEPGGFLLAFSALFVLAGRCFLRPLPLKR